MGAKSWLQKANPFARTENIKVKALEEKLDAIVSEQMDLDAYSVKYLDTEIGTGEGAITDMIGIEQQIDTAALQRIYCTETWVYSAITAIAETVGSLPIKLEKAKKIPKQVTNPVTGEAETIEEKVWTDASGEPLADVFQYPNKYTTKTEFFMLLVIDLLSTGEYYICLDPVDGVNLSSIEIDITDEDPNSPFGRLRTVMAAKKPIAGMYRLPPALMKPVLSEDRRCVEGYAMQTDAGSFAFNAAEIIHVKLPNPMNPLIGLSPLIAAMKPILIERFATEHIIRFWKSGARLGGVVETDKSLNKEQLARFQRSFENNYTGRQNHHRTLILPPGMKYNPIEQNPAQTALIDFSKYNREAILSVLKVPPIKLGILDGSSYANANAQLKTFYNDCIKPKLAFIQDGFNLKSCLMPDNRSFRMQFDLSNIEELKEDLKTTAEAGKAMLEAGLTVNEVRKKVWKTGPITGGDKAPTVEKMKEGGGAFPLLMRSATPGDYKDGRNPEMVAPTDIKPSVSTFTDRVNELVGQMVQSGIPLHLAVPKAMEQARLEGFTDKDPDAKLGTLENSAVIPTEVGTVKPEEPCKCPDGKPDCDECKKKKPSLSEYLTDALGKLDSAEPVDQELIAELMKLYEEQWGEKDIGGAYVKPPVPLTPDQNAAPAVEIDPRGDMRRHAVDKEAATAQWKSFISATDPLIEKRADEVRKFFKKFQQIVMNRIGANLKAYGIHKSRDSEDIDDILELDAYKDLIAKYTDEVDKAMLQAYQYGFDATLAKFDFRQTDEKAVAYLEKYAAESVKHITETTRDQLRSVLKDAFERGDSMGDVSKAIREKFVEIDQGRAITIARTETLAAVSAGRVEKREEWKQRFPDKQLKKQWISAQDAKVRDSHAEVDGEVVDADETYSNGLKHPRDPDASAEEVVNCRCDEITFVAEDADLVAESLSAEEGKAFNPDQDRDSSGRWGSGGDGTSDGAAKPKASDLSKETQAHIERRAEGKGEAVSMSREQLTDVMDHGTYSLISAGRNPKIPEDVALSEVQIIDRYNKMEADLKQAGYAYTRVKGKYGAEEDSFMVYDGDRTEMKKLGEKYNQDSIIQSDRQKNEMLFTVGENAGKSQNGEGYTWQDSADDFYTEMTLDNGNKAKFQLNFDFSNPPKGFCPLHRKGGPGSGCRGPNCGRHGGGAHEIGKPHRISEGGASSGPPVYPSDQAGYDRPKVAQLAPKELSGGQRNNGLEDKDFSDKKGKELSVKETSRFHQAASRELAQNVNPAMERFVKDAQDEGVNIVSFKTRAKDVDSLTSKMNGKWENKTLNQVTDGIGARVVVKNMRDLDKTVAKAERLTGMKILEHKDYSSEPQDGGYRATHLIARSKSGMMVEIQVKTENQDTWSRWSHGNLYKSGLGEDKEVASYARAVSDRLQKIDLGHKVTGDLPAAPKSLKDKGLEFPWGNVNNDPFKQ